MDSSLHAFDFLVDHPKPPPTGVCVVFGDDRFLRQLARGQLQRLVSQDGTATRWDGQQVQWRDVIDELQTVSLFGSGPRVVMVIDADAFVSANRTRLEQLAADAPGSGYLILDVASFPSNTRLYKAVAGSGMMIECRAPRKSRGANAVLDEPRLKKWVGDWASRQHGVRLLRGADEELLDLVGPELGLLDQELAKLALFADREGGVTIETVRDVVGGWRKKSTWELLDAALDGNAADALRQLARLLDAGEAPQAVFGAISWSLRRFAAAAAAIREAELAGRKTAIPAALEQAGFKKWPPGALGQAQRQLRQIGRQRAGQLYARLLEVDRAMKSTHSSPDRARWALENLLLWLSKQATPGTTRRASP